MKKVLLTLFFALLTIVSWAYDVQVDGIYYNLVSKTKTAEVTNTTGGGYANSYSGNIVIPEHITVHGATYSVTSICNYAFSNCLNLTSVTIGNSVTSIGERAFSFCSGLTSVTIGNSVTSICNYAFYRCSGLTSVTIGNSVTSIDEWAFYDCSGLTSVEIPNSVTSIGDNAFYRCSGLTSVTMGNSLVNIGNYAFYKCSGLTSVTIPNSVTSIGNEAFSGCSGLTSVTIGNSVTSIGDHAFWSCSGLTSVEIPNSVTSIGDYAFLDCSGLTSVEIPNSVTSIGSYAFSGCSGLTSVTIPNSMTSIDNYAFRNCTGLTSVEIPNSVTGIGKSAFSMCSGLTSVTIGNSVTSIGDEAFKDCNILANVTDLSTTPQTISNDVFSVFGILHVLPGCKEAYENALNWRMFSVKEDAQMPVDPSLNQCAKPVISYEYGSLVFTCNTAGAVCHSNIEVLDAGLHDGNTINLNATYNITVYATMDGYNSSEVATATLIWLNASLEADAINAPEIRVPARPMLVNSENGIVQLSGLNEGELVEVYSADGKKINSIRSTGDTANFVAKSGEVVVLKIGEEMIKTIVK